MHRLLRPLPLQRSRTSPVSAPPSKSASQGAVAGAGLPLATVPIEEEFENRLKVAQTQRDSLASTLLGAWQNYFEQCMILLFQQDHLVVWWFNDKWKGNVSRGQHITLDTPKYF